MSADLVRTMNLMSRLAPPRGRYSRDEARPNPHPESIRRGCYGGVLSEQEQRRGKDWQR